MIASRSSDVPSVTMSVHEECVMSQSGLDCQLYTLVNGVTGVCDGTISLEAIPSFGAL